MTTVGFDPERTRSLAVHVRSAIDELAAITSPDPAAVDALRVVALAEHNLRTSWIPLLERIAATAALTSWRRSDLSAGSHVDCLVRAVLLARLRRRAGGMRHDTDGRPVGGDATGPWLEGLLAGIRRHLTDPDFRQALLDTVTEEPSVAWLLVSEDLDAALRADVLVTLLGTVGRIHGTEWEAVAGAAGELMDGLRARPAEALRVLTDRHALGLLAEWPPLDQGTVAEFTHTALATAVHERPRLHADGVEVLRQLVDLSTHHRVDRTGFLPGVSVGVASSVGAYAAGFVDTVRLESGSITARSRGVGGDLDVTLGSYAEMVDFFGAVMRDEPAAQEILGAELAAMTRLAVVGGDGVPPTLRVDTIAELAQLLQHAARNENEEARLAGAARRAGALDASTLFGLTTTALFLAARGTSPVAQFALDRGVKDLVDLAARPRPSRVPVTIDLAKATHQAIVTAAIGHAATDPALRRDRGIGGGAREWAEIEASLHRLQEAAGEGSDPDGVDRRIQQLEADARRLGAGDHLDGFLRRPAVHDLTSASGRG